MLKLKNMSNSIRKKSGKSGLPPGALVHVGKKKSDHVRISLMDYTPDDFKELACDKLSECTPFITSPSVTWINIDGLHDTPLIASVGELFGLHHLLLEDVLNTNHRPKTEEFTNCHFITLKMLGIDKNGRSIIHEQVSLVLGKGWVISFQEQQGDIFDSLRDRIREAKGNIRELGADYLLYRLIDTIVDNYFLVTEHLSDAITRLEEQVIASSDRLQLIEIQHLRKQLIQLRKNVTPLREAVLALQKDSTPLIQQKTIKYLHDVYEHIIQVNDSFDSHRDTLSALMDLYHTSVSNRMNQVMQVLTIISTIFIPLTFIAGIYGMNFNNMPELQTQNGYYVTLAVMAVIVITMLIFFKRKKWL